MIFTQHSGKRAEQSNQTFGKVNPTRKPNCHRSYLLLGHRCLVGEVCQMMGPVCNRSEFRCCLSRISFFAEKENIGQVPVCVDPVHESGNRRLPKVRKTSTLCGPVIYDNYVCE